MRGGGKHLFPGDGRSRPLEDPVPRRRRAAPLQALRCAPMSDSASRGFQAPPAAYDRHVGRYGAELAHALCEHAGVRAGDRVIDVGCGPGALTEHLATRIGVTRVAAVDPSIVFLDACRARVPTADARLAPAEDLPFPDAAFDVALAQLVVNFMADPGVGVGEMRRVTRPGGTVAAAVWDYAAGMRLLRTFWDAAAATGGDSARRLDEGLVMQRWNAETLRALWEAVGLASIRTGSVQVAAEYDGLDDLWAPFLAGVGPAGAYVVSLDGATRGALQAEFFRRLGDPDGPFRLEARAWYVVGVVPGG